MDNISTYDFINNKYTMDDYMECFIITMGILLIVYMFVISRSEPTMLLIITFALVFVFLVMVQKKYKDKYNTKVQDVRRKLNLIRDKLNLSGDDILDEEDLLDDDIDIPPDNDKPHHKYKPHHKHKPHSKNDNGIIIRPGKNIPPDNTPGSGPRCIDCLDHNQNLSWKTATDECGCNSEQKCATCANCKWCGGTCIPKTTPCTIIPDSGGTNSKNKSKCFIGDTNLANIPAYRNNDCNLFSNYGKCIKCADKHKCGYLQPDGNVLCKTCTDTNDAYYQQDGTINPTTNCLKLPDDGGFGCQGASYSADNVAPINPKISQNKVCTYSPT